MEISVILNYGLKRITMIYAGHEQNFKIIINRLWQYIEDQDIQQIYAILDAARDDVIYPKIKDSNFEKGCLYQGQEAKGFAEVAPYLLILQKEDSFTDWLLNNGWGNSWGIFLTSIADFNAVQNHFRQFIFIEDENGREMFFRFYDPRVLRVFLPACNIEEAQRFFGPVDHFFMEDEHGKRLLKFTCTETGVDMT